MVRLLVILPVLVMFVFAVVAVLPSAPTMPTMQSGQGMAAPIYLWRIPAYADAGWKIELRPPYEKSLWGLRVMAATPPPSWW